MANNVILLDTYRAISSAPFLWLACTDPLLAAFNLAVDLKVCEEMVNEHKVCFRADNRFFFSNDSLSINNVSNTGHLKLEERILKCPTSFTSHFIKDFHVFQNSNLCPVNFYEEKTDR